MLLSLQPRPIREFQSCSVLSVLDRHSFSDTEQCLSMHPHQLHPLFSTCCYICVQPVLSLFKLAPVQTGSKVETDCFCKKIFIGKRGNLWKADRVYPAPVKEGKATASQQKYRQRGLKKGTSFIDSEGSFPDAERKARCVLWAESKQAQLSEITQLCCSSDGKAAYEETPMH